MSAHTPGPWSIGSEWIDDGDGSEVERFFVQSLDGEPLSDTPIAYGDAVLMSAAPSMLAVLVELFEISTTFISAIEADHNVDLEDWAEKARAAIALAKGEVQP